MTQVAKNRINVSCISHLFQQLSSFPSNLALSLVFQQLLSVHLVLQKQIGLKTLVSFCKSTGISNIHMYL